MKDSLKVNLVIYVFPWQVTETLIQRTFVDLVLSTHLTTSHFASIKIRLIFDFFWGWEHFHTAKTLNLYALQWGFIFELLYTTCIPCLCKIYPAWFVKTYIKNYISVSESKRYLLDSIILKNFFVIFKVHYLKKVFHM